MTNHLVDIDLDKFHRLPIAERRSLASTILDGVYTLSKAHGQDRCHYVDTNGFIAYVAVKLQLDHAVKFWRREMQRAAWDSKNKKGFTGAGRRPAIKAHGCAAVASLAGSFIHAVNQRGNAKKVTA
jgi:hypothetical protein